uniref:Putative ovule protein n=1 Tax=Solanum chacoense TaxID=4108 RepID=A0A0V0GWM4_SOLCH
MPLSSCVLHPIVNLFIVLPSLGCASPQITFNYYFIHHHDKRVPITNMYNLEYKGSHCYKPLNF